MPDHQGSMFPEPPPLPGSEGAGVPPPAGAPPAYGSTVPGPPMTSFGAVPGQDARPPDPGPAAGPTSWAGFALPPDDDRPPPARTAPDPAQWMPPPAPRSPRSSTGSVLLVVGAIALALVLGVGATLLVVRPWSAATQADAQNRVGPTVPQQGNASPFYAPGSPSTTREDPGTQLAQRAASDESTIRNAVPEGWWVPQISSKNVGMRADGIVYGEADIWRDHSTLRSRYDAVLLDSDDYATFTAPGRFWVTIVPSQATSSPDAANGWCRQNGFTPDTCYAKVIGHSTYSVTTKHWR